MSEYDWHLSSGAPLCTVSDSFYYTARDAIFRCLTPETTQRQFLEAMESLTRLRDELVQDVKPMHYGALVGRHRCLDQLFTEARARLRSLAVLQPELKPPAPPPARRQPPRSADAVVNDVWSLADTIKQPGNIFLGEERQDNAASGGSR
jgi:hypothetical protein